MIELKRFIADLEACIGWPYESPGGTGADCSKSGIDCSGMAVRAYKLQGEKIYHGSNTIWRDGSLSEKGILTNEKQLFPGCFVFMHRDWRPNNEDDRKNKYFGDKEGNMHHMGYVVSVNPLVIIDASYSAGQVRLTKSIKSVGWNRWGRATKINYQSDVTVPAKTEAKKETGKMKVTVKTGNGKGANIRERQTTTSSLLGVIPEGETISIDKLGASWTKVSYDGIDGWVLSKLLVEVDEPLDMERRVGRIEEVLKDHGWL